MTDCLRLAPLICRTRCRRIGAAIATALLLLPGLSAAQEAAASVAPAPPAGSKSDSAAAPKGTVASQDDTGGANGSSGDAAHGMDSAPLRDRTPRYIVYYGAKVSPLADVAQTDFTHVHLSFLTVPETGGAGPLTLVAPDVMEGQWPSVEVLKQAGKLVLVSFGGGDMTAKAWARVAGREDEAARLIADFVKENGLQGVGLDFEISESFHGKSPPFDGRKMLIDLTRALRKALPEGALISHAPESAYLSRNWHGAPYLDVLRAVGDEIDWVAIQYYNNPAFDAPVASHILGTGDTVSDSSVAGLVQGLGGYAIPVKKLVVGKPIYHADASSGHMTPADVRSQILEPLAQAYGAGFGGLMGWQFADDTDDHRYWNSDMAHGTAILGSD